MRLGRIARARFAVLVVLGAASLAAAAPAGASWQETAKVPSSGAPGFPFNIAAGLSEDGGGAMAYRSADDLVVATREQAGGAWALKSFSELGFGLEDMDLDMNAAGDIVVGWFAQDDFATVAYKPAGGAWEAHKVLDNNANGDGGVDVAINTAGTAIVAWNAGKSTPSPTDEIRAVIRPKAGPWPATNGYAVAASEPHGGAEVFAIGCGGPAVAIDDLGRVLAAWSSVYGSFDLLFEEPGFCGVRTTIWNGASWTAPNDLTPRPAIGFKATTDQPAPSAGTPDADADPVSGKLNLAFRYSADSYDFNEEEFFNDEGWSNVVYGGTVAGGPTGGVESSVIGAIGELAVAVNGSHAAVASWEFDGQPEGQWSTRSVVGASGTGLALTPLGTAPERRHPTAAIGGDGRPFIGFQDLTGSKSALAWTASPSQALCPPRTILAPTASAPSAAANAAGDGIVAAANATGLYYADYSSDTAGCGGSEPGGGGGGPIPSQAGPPAPEPLSNKVTVKAPKSLPDGKVEVVVAVPGAGSLGLKGTAKVDSADLARASAKKTIVVTQKSAKATKAGKLTFKLAPNSKAAKVVKKQGKLSAKLAITFTPSGGSAATTTKTVVFKAPKKSGK
jgi:hypothetical protein